MYTCSRRTLLRIAAGVALAALPTAVLTAGSPTKLRTVYLVIGDTRLRLPGMRYLRRGDQFTMTEPDGTPVKDRYGNTVFTAANDPAFDKESNVLGISVVENREQKRG